ncbi:hypothetical protein G6F57_003514 [Rhizopus arrhizus]|uniref:Uncharacterized protein n=1 Tax=Rhizopus oryzae TaxID=64495 RepID=A0A9P6XM57_RHIOR|nr:hypothetical protein G6F23_000280 [Rhizopus arrhizus]KAG1429342.1 hypothetical protein G6F58_000089 [Rhizopus delemar]KAG0767995.1 hypothetical protein G6F24_002323 [Rhizopus arrhizus]KAG0793744.1 hypothetical protein G6F21_003387 [Rhizopus arrhizus]KAG0802365.1 hypothetical protein G6F22_000330 [Rhizopus arrhizus]
MGFERFTVFTAYPLSSHASSIAQHTLFHGKLSKKYVTNESNELIPRLFFIAIHFERTSPLAAFIARSIHSAWTSKQQTSIISANTAPSPT